MARKTVLIASNTDVFKEIYKDNAIFFDPKSIESISISLQKIIDMDKLEMEKRTKKAQKYARSFTWKKTAQKTLNLYNEFSEK